MLVMSVPFATYHLLRSSTHTCYSCCRVEVRSRNRSQSNDHTPKRGRTRECISRGAIQDIEPPREGEHGLAEGFTDKLRGRWNKPLNLRILLCRTSDPLEGSGKSRTDDLEERVNGVVDEAQREHWIRRYQGHLLD